MEGGDTMDTSIPLLPVDDGDGIFSVFIAVSGSFAYGSAVGYSSPVESAVEDDLGLSTAQFSLFGSLLTAGGLLGSLLSGKIADLIGGRGLMTSCRILVMFFAGSLIPWCILVLIGIIPSLLQLLGIFLIPESARFLAKIGKNKAEEIVLQRLRGSNFDISQEAAAIQELSEGIEQTPEVGFLGLFQMRYALPLVVVFGLMTLAGFARPSGLTYYASSVFESAGFSSSIGATVMALLQVPSIAIGMYLIDKCGRRPLLMLSAGAMCFCCFLDGLMFLLRENDSLQSINPYLIVLGLWGYSAAFPLGIAAIPFVLMSEIFPMNVKGPAGSLAAVVSSGRARSSYSEALTLSPSCLLNFDSNIRASLCGASGIVVFPCLSLSSRETDVVVECCGRASYLAQVVT